MRPAEGTKGHDAVRDFLITISILWITALTYLMYFAFKQ